MIWWKWVGILLIGLLILIIYNRFWGDVSSVSNDNVFDKLQKGEMTLDDAGKTLKRRSSKIKISRKKPPKESRGERKCREVLEKIFNKPFPKSRPDFMFNPVTNENLEIDCFNLDMKLGCEYNGRQHYHYNKWMHKGSFSNFRAQQYRDRLKRESCQKLGIRLIEVPYTVKVEGIEDFIKTELKKFNIVF